MNWIIIAKTILDLLPAILKAVKAIEAEIPQSDAGKKKLALVRTVLESAYDIGDKAVGSFDDLWPALNKAIDGVVAVFNAIGVFKK